MVRIQTEFGYIDLKEGVASPVSYSVADIRDMSKRTGATSKTLTALGTANNNKILGYLFDVNITDFSYDINRVVTCQLLEDDVNILANATLQLVDVKKSQTGINQDEEVSYSLVVKSQQADLFTAMDNKELSELDFTEMQHTFNATNVIASFDHDVTDGYVYVRGMSDDNDLAITDFRPAIYLKRYLDKIHATNGYSYEVQDLPIFEKLVIPFNGESAVGNFNSYHAQVSKSTFSSSVPPVNITGWTEILDEEAIFNPTTGVVTSPYYFGIGAGMTFTVNCSYDVVLNNATGSNAFLTKSNGFGALIASEFGVGASLEVYKNGFLASSPILSIASTAVFQSTSNPLVNGVTTLATINVTTTFAITNILQNDELTFRLVPDTIPDGSQKWRDANSLSGNIVTITPRIDMDSILMDINFTVNSFGFGQTTDMNLFIPKKIKQKDLVKAFTTMFYLMAIPDEDNANKIIYVPRNEWLDNGASVDWSEKLAKDKDQDIKFLPELSAKKLLLTYKEDSDSYNKAYKENINEVYGEVTFTYDNEFVKGIDKKEIAFSATPMVRDSTGSVVPSWAGVSPKNNIRILQHNGSIASPAYNIYNYASVGSTGVVVHPNVGHFDHPTNPTTDLNFGICDYYFYDGISLTNNNVFNMYWRRAVSQINNGKLLTAFFDLNAYDIFKMRLNDKIWLNNSWWNINKIIDYDASLQGLTKVELISADDYLDLPNFRTVITTLNPIGWGGFPSSVIYQQNNAEKNINLSPNVTIIGKGNVVDQDLKGILVGNDKVINQSSELSINNETVATPDTSSETKVWKGLISQSGTSAPTAIVLENTLGGTITFAYSSVGVYTATLVGAFTLDKTFIIANNVDDGFLGVARNSDDVINFGSTDTSLAASNNILNKIALSIEIYP